MYEFDLKTLWTVIKSKRKMILRNCVIAGIAAVIIGYSIPKVFMSKVELVAEMREEGGMGGAASLAALAGFDLNMGGEAIGPNLYPNVVSSNAFMSDLLDINVKTIDGEFHGTFDEYLSTQTKSPWWSYPMKWFKGWFAKKSTDNDSEGNHTIDPERMTAEETALISSLRSTILCETSSSDGIITITVRAQDPLVAKTMVDSVTVRLQNFITDYRTNKARNDLNYYQQLERESLKKYKDAQYAYAQFCDTHKDLSTKAFLMEERSLENDLELAFSSYTQTNQQVTMGLAKVQENTPAFTVINKATVPPLAESPKKTIILAAVLFFTLVGTLCWIYFKLLFSK